MDGISHILSPMSAPWCGWTMLVLLLCAVLGELAQPGVISQASASLLSRNDRTYKNAPVNFIGQSLITLFRIGTLAMALFLCFYQKGDFGFGAFVLLCGIIFAILLIKMLCNALLDYTFQLTRHYAPVYEQYGDLSTIMSCILYPFLLIGIQLGITGYYRWVLGLVAGLFLLIWLYRMAHNYIRTPMAILYVILYMGTMEVLPFGALLYISSKTISI